MWYSHTVGYLTTAIKRSEVVIHVIDKPEKYNLRLEMSNTGVI